MLIKLAKNCEEILELLRFFCKDCLNPLYDNCMFFKEILR